jgi:diguanylate cyclase
MDSPFPNPRDRPAGRWQAFRPDDVGSAGYPRAGVGEALQFIRRIHRLRTVGLGLGFFCVAAVLQLHGDPPWAWVLLGANGFLWPHLAWILSVRSKDPVRTEIRNLVADSAFGGIWIAVMQFNLLPSVLLATMLTVDKVSVGGLRLTIRTCTAMLTTCGLAAAALGLPVDLATPMPVVAACVPFLVVYPLLISNVMHALGQEVTRKNRQLEAISRTDDLTGLANRRHALEVAEAELSRHRRTARPCVLVVIDIDNFKNINDRYGHPAGDAILRTIATILRDASRTMDTPARLAGDEFMLLLPEASIGGAMEVVDRIRQRLQLAAPLRVPDFNCTASFGAAEAHPEMVDVEDWIQQADAALYRAKAAGRDRFVAAPPVAPVVRSDVGRTVHIA